MILINPSAGKPVDVPDALVDRLLALGFTKDEQEQQQEKPKRGRPRKAS